MKESEDRLNRMRDEFLRKMNSGTIRIHLIVRSKNLLFIHSKRSTAFNKCLYHSMFFHKFLVLNDKCL